MVGEGVEVGLGAVVVGVWVVAGAEGVSVGGAGGAGVVGGREEKVEGGAGVVGGAAGAVG